MSRKTLSPASVFERVLRAHETGGVTFKDVRAQLKDLLAAGASPADLLETLRRQEQWEPLPESARVEVVGLIDEAIRTAPRNDDSVEVAQSASEPAPPAPPAPSTDNVVANGGQPEEPAGDLTAGARVRRPAPSENVRSLEARIAGQQADYTNLTRSYERAREAESAANTRVSALSALLVALEASRDADHAKAQQSAATLAETMAANNALHARAESAVRDASDARSEIRGLGELLQARDAALAEARQLLDAGAAELEAVRHALLAEQSTSRAAAQSAERSIETLQSDSRSREAGSDAELQALRAALAAEQANGQHARDALSVRDSAHAEAQKSLSVRVDELERLLQTAHSTLAEAQRSAGEREAGRDTELQALRAALSARDVTLAEAQRSLGTRSAGLEALQSDLQAAHSALAEAHSTLAEAQRSAGEREVGQDIELQALRAALAAEQAKSQHAAQSVEQSQEILCSLRDSLSARDVTLAEAQRSLGARSAGLEALQSDLQAARSALAEALENIRTLRDSLSARDVALVEAQRLLGTRSAGLEALQSDLQAARLALAEEQRSGVERGAGHDTELQALREQSQENIRALRDSLSARDAAIVEAQHIRQTERVPLSVPIRRVGRPNRVAVIAAIGFILFCGVAAYFMNHRAPPPAPAPVAVSIAPALPKPGTVIRDCLTCPEIMVLPTGEFSQGSAGPGVGPAAFEKPLHVVTISGAIGMATNLVTVDEFQQFIAASGWQSQGCTTYDGEWKARPRNNWSNPGFPQTGKHPVTCASWNDAQAYAKWLSAKAGHTYRLPSASEWEYAARAGSEAVAPWTAESAACANANVADNTAARRYPGWTAFNCDDGYVYTSPVGSFKANAFGLNDMLGNVFQWTEDCWHPDYVGAPSDGTARTDGPCDEHELRGGSWFTTPAFVRANYRNHFTADYRSSTVGIRLVRDFGA